MKYDYSIFEGALAFLIIASLCLSVFLGDHLLAAIYLCTIHISGVLVARLPRKE